MSAMSDLDVQRFDYAVETARHFIPVTKKIRREEFWCGSTIVLGSDDLYHVYSSDAWTPQTESLLPWSAPRGQVVAHVDMEGVVSPA